MKDLSPLELEYLWRLALTVVLVFIPAVSTEQHHVMTQAAHQVPVIYRTPTYEGEYGAEACQMLAEFRSNLFTSVQETLLLNNNEELNSGAWARLFQSYLHCPPDQPGEQYGVGEGEKKMMCSIDSLPEDEAPCVVYSFGSDGDFVFEEDVLQRTSCQVYTFDCTYRGRSIHPRHEYVEMCIGSQGAADAYSNIMSYRQILEKYSHERVEVVKVDIESFEYDFLADLTEDLGERLPRQLVVEYHYENYAAEDTYRVPSFLKPRVPPPLYPSPLAAPSMFTTRGWNITTQDMALMQFHLANLGYGIVLAESFHDSDKIQEFTYLRVEDIRSLAVTY